jgi:protein SCO1
MAAVQPRRPAAAVLALASVLAVTAGWWALALWPVDDAPAWLTLTRETCFGMRETGLPDAGGWLVLVGQPLSMLLILLAAWGGDVLAGLRALTRRMAGQLAVGAASALLVAGVLGAAVRVRVADARPFATSTTEEIAGRLNRIDDAPKPFALVDQHGDTVTLAQFRGRPVLLTFAYAGCATVCPLVVDDVLTARDELAATRNPVVLVVTLDPWRDTPSRLPAIAARWGMTGDARMLGGTTEQVERVLNAWRVPRARNERTGDLSHPTLVYVIGPDGRIAYVVNGSRRVIRAAVEAL